MGVTLPAAIAASRINLRQRQPARAEMEVEAVTKSTPLKTSPYFNPNWLTNYLPVLASHINKPLLQAIYAQLTPLTLSRELAVAQSELNQAREILNKNRQKLLACQDLRSKEKAQILSEINQATHVIIAKYEHVKRLHQKAAEIEASSKFNNEIYHTLIRSLENYQKEAQAIHTKKEALLDRASFFRKLMPLLALIVICIFAITYPFALIGILPVLSLLVGILIIKPRYLAHKLHNQHPSNEIELRDCFNHFTQTLEQGVVKTADPYQTKNVLSQTVQPEYSRTTTISNLSGESLCS